MRSATLYRGIMHFERCVVRTMDCQEWHTGWNYNHPARGNYGGPYTLPCRARTQPLSYLLQPNPSRPATASAGADSAGEASGPAAAIGGPPLACKRCALRTYPMPHIRGDAMTIRAQKSTSAWRRGAPFRLLGPCRALGGARPGNFSSRPAAPGRVYLWGRYGGQRRTRDTKGPGSRAHQYSDVARMGGLVVCGAQQPSRLSMSPAPCTWYVCIVPRGKTALVRLSIQRTCRVRNP